jgi:SAM-dependent methyltransferase
LNAAGETKIDLEWNDDGVVPPKVTPDLVFLFDRMIEATIAKVDPSRGNIVLDVGCGRAVDALQIARKGGKPVGLEPSRTMLGHCKQCIADKGGGVGLVQGIGEHLPFKTGSFDWVVCKGALDHFPDPHKAVDEMARVVKPDGRVVISIANFESLGHRLGRKVHRLTRWLPRRGPEKRQAWETPPDHTLRFDYPLIVEVVGSHLDIEESSGIGLLWGAPLWDRITSAMPKRVSFFVMGTLDRLARRWPSLSDVVLVQCRRKPAGL